MSIHTVLDTIISGISLKRDEMQRVMETIMTGKATPVQISAFLIAMRMKGETTEELATAASVMRTLATPVDVIDDTHLIDTCGTGGDGARTFNISTASAFVAAACGAVIAKHGNRAVSSSSGSSDVLTTAGAVLTLPPTALTACLDTIGFAFLFAPNHHAAMQYAAPVRKELGLRTLFNMIGPLTNPAGAKRHVLGVYDRALTTRLAEALQALGSIHALVVHSADGLDEISCNAPTHVAELKNNTITEYDIAPEDFGYARTPLDVIRADTAAESHDIICRAFAGDHPTAQTILALNAGAAVYAAGCTDTLAHGVQTARNALDSGAAQKCFRDYIAYTKQYAT